MFAPALKLPEPAHFFGKKVETAGSKKEDRTRACNKRGDAVSLPQGYRETSPNEKAKKDKDTAENSGRHVSSGIGHSKGDSEEAEKRAGQRVRDSIPVLGFVGGAKAIVESSSIVCQAYHIGPGEFIGRQKSGGKSFWRDSAFGKNELVEKGAESFLSLRRAIIGTTSALKVPDASLVERGRGKDFRQIFAIGFRPEEDFEVFCLFLFQMNPADVPDVALGGVGQKGRAIDDLLKCVFLDPIFFDLFFRLFAAGLGGRREGVGENIKNHREAGTADEERFRKGDRAHS